MDLVGAWLRQLLKAGTAAAIVPAAMVAAVVVVIVGAGGFGGLGAIGQLVSGPAISPAEREVARVPGGGSDLAPVAPAVASESVRRRAPAAPTGERVSPPPPPPDVRSEPRPPAVDPGPPPTVRPPRPPVITRPPPPPPAAAPAVPRPPTLKERTQVLGDKLKETVGDVGTAVQEIVDVLRETLRRIVNPPPKTGP